VRATDPACRAVKVGAESQVWSESCGGARRGCTKRASRAHVVQCVACGGSRASHIARIRAQVKGIKGEHIPPFLAARCSDNSQFSLANVHLPLLVAPAFTSSQAMISSNRRPARLWQHSERRCSMTPVARRRSRTVEEHTELGRRRLDAWSSTMESTARAQGGARSSGRGWGTASGRQDVAVLIDGKQLVRHEVGCKRAQSGKVAGCCEAQWCDHGGRKMAW
jgi:hypothetical protein